MSGKDDDVGYGKPPREHRWKPGQSGNPSGKNGRSKPLQAFNDTFAEQLMEPIEITINGKKKKMPFGVALITKFLHGVMSAPVKQQCEAFRLIQALGIPDIQKRFLEQAANDDEDIYLTEEERLLLEIIKAEMEGHD